MRQGRERRGWVGSGTERCGRELAIVDRVLATVPLRVLWQAHASKGEVWSGRARRGSARANVAAMGLVTVPWSMQTVH